MELITKLLTESIQGETLAATRYSTFAEHAVSAGYPGIAVLFSGLADAEAIHIANHKRALEKNNSTPPDIAGSEKISTGTIPENIAAAIAGEKEEVTSIYPSFIKQIKNRHGRDFTARIALLSLSWALDAEKGHLDLLEWAGKKIAKRQDLSPDNFYLCSVCGNLVYREQPPRTICEVCGHDAHFYNRVQV